MERIVELVTVYGLKVLGAIAILIVGRIVAGLVRRGVARALNRAHTDPSLVSFAGSLTFALVMTFAVLAALAKFGVETASFIAVLGAVGFAIGFALQGSLANFAAGVLLLVLRPFKVGDFIEGGGVAGSVKSIQLFTTELATPDNVKILVPNGKLFSDNIKNFAGYETRRVQVDVGIAYDAPIGKAKEILERLIGEDPRILPDPAPAVLVTALADSSVNLAMRVWVKRDDYWGLFFDMNRRIKESYDAEGIEIPFPQRVVHMKQA